MQPTDAEMKAWCLKRIRDNSRNNPPLTLREVSRLAICSHATIADKLANGEITPTEILGLVMEVYEKRSAGAFIERFAKFVQTEGL